MRKANGALSSGVACGSCGEVGKHSDLPHCAGRCSSKVPLSQSCTRGELSACHGTPGRVGCVACRNCASGVAGLSAASSLNMSGADPRLAPRVKRTISKQCKLQAPGRHPAASGEGCHHLTAGSGVLLTLMDPHAMGRVCIQEPNGRTPRPPHHSPHTGLVPSPYTATGHISHAAPRQRAQTGKEQDCSSRSHVPTRTSTIIQFVGHQN